MRGKRAHLRHKTRKEFSEGKILEREFEGGRGFGAYIVGVIEIQDSRAFLLYLLVRPCTTIERCVPVGSLVALLGYGVVKWSPGLTCAYND